MADIPSPPTYAEVVLLDEKSKKPVFNPIWLRWFVDLAQIINTGGGTVLDHNSMAGLQGGIATQFYHLTAAEYAALAAGSSSEILATRAFRQVEFIRPVQWDETQNIIANQVFGG